MFIIAGLILFYCLRGRNCALFLSILDEVKYDVLSRHLPISSFQSHKGGERAKTEGEGMSFDYSF